MHHINILMLIVYRLKAQGPRVSCTWRSGIYFIGASLKYICTLMTKDL